MVQKNRMIAISSCVTALKKQISIAVSNMFKLHRTYVKALCSHTVDSGHCVSLMDQSCISMILDGVK